MIMSQPDGPRIALIHALEASVLPIRQAFQTHWPEAVCADLLDTSLSADLAAAGKLDAAMVKRFTTLGDYAAGITGEGGKTRAVLFTCSAFGPAIEAVRQRLPIPVLKPNEAAFEQALALGRNIALVVTFAPSQSALGEELRQMAAVRGIEIAVTPVMVQGALAALNAGDPERHDTLVAEACTALPTVDAIVLGQFSLARAKAALTAVTSAPILTTPDSAVLALRSRLAIPAQEDRA